MEVKDNAGAIAALADIANGSASGVEQDQYSLNYSCAYSYAFTVPTDSPVYSFNVYYERLDTIEPWTSTVNTSNLVAGDAPKPHLSFCPSCS